MKDKSETLTPADVVALAACTVAILFGLLSVHLWLDNQRLEKTVKTKLSVTQTFECQ
jgi:hypothetical protein